VARSEESAGFVEELPLQEAAAAGAPLNLSSRGLRREPPLDRVPRLGIDDRRVLALVALSIVGDATDIQRVAQ
jgi:hypothetical protein